MTHQSRNLPWLDRLTVHIPSYAGYQERDARRAADQALRDAVAARLAEARTRLEETARQLLRRDNESMAGQIAAVAGGDLRAADALEPHRHDLRTEADALRRVEAHLDRVRDRLRTTGAGPDDFYGAGPLDHPRADALHALDHDLHDRALRLLRRFDEPDRDHNFLANIEADLQALEAKLDERALAFGEVR